MNLAYTSYSILSNKLNELILLVLRSWISKKEKYIVVVFQRLPQQLEVKEGEFFIF